MIITNGRVSRTVKPADYEARTVAYSFTIDPGDDVDAMTATVVALAEHHARTLPSAIPRPATLPREPHPTGDTIVGWAEPVPVQPRPRGRRVPQVPAEDIKADSVMEGVAEALSAGVYDDSAAITEPAAPMTATEILRAVGGKGTLSAAKVFEATNPAAIPEPVFLINEDPGKVVEPPSSKPITDRELADACAAKSAAKGAGYDVMAVRKLIGVYAAPGLRLSEIAAEKRPAFLQALRVL